MIRCVLFDLDGVIRHFDPAFVNEIERRRGLAPGSILRAAFASPAIDAVTTGRITREEWVVGVGRQIGDPDATVEWGHQPWTVDAEVIAIADELRAAGLAMAILTNGTDTIPAEIAACGRDRHVDAVFNSAEIGFSKPDPLAFRHALDALRMPAGEVFFTDDSAAKLAGAEALGMSVHLFRGTAGLRAALRGHGILD